MQAFDDIMIIKRLTTKYDVTQDRLRLAGETDDGQALVLWLTQRLMNRLAPHLCRSLEAQSSVPLRTPDATTAPVASAVTQVKQTFAQERARAALPRQAPVRSDAQTPDVLVHSVDVKATRAGLTLAFKIGDEIAAKVLLPHQALRQWLNIVYDQYRAAGWATSVWPAWIEESRPRKTTSRAALH